MKKEPPGCLGYLFGDYITQFLQDLKKKHDNDPIRSLLLFNNQYFMERKGPPSSVFIAPESLSLW